MRIVVITLLALYLDYAHSHGWRQVRSVRTARRILDPTVKRVVCYYSSMAVYREDEGKLLPEDIDPHLCTHILYAYATLDDDMIEPFDPQQDIGEMGFSKFSMLTKMNPNLKVMLTLGGSMESSKKFFKQVADPKFRKRFAKNARNFTVSNGFHGLDLFWQYPAFAEESALHDNENCIELFKALREEFKDDLCLSLAVPKWKCLIDKGLDYARLAKYMDFMNVLTYDYHEATDDTVNHIAPLYPIPEDPDKYSNIDTTIHHYVSQGVDPAKLNLGIPLYGARFILKDPMKNEIGSLTEDKGSSLQDRGSLYFNELCHKIKRETWTVKHVNKTAMGPFAYKDKLWLSYDDEDMVKTKAHYAAKWKFGGIMFWSIDMDDFKGHCHGQTYPMIKAGKQAFLCTK